MSLNPWMKFEIDDLSPEVLLRETAWLNGLARQLVTDPHRAEDVAQDAWVALAQHRGPVAELRPWLRRVTWNLASRLRHRESQRHEREASAARSDAQPSAAESVERIRVQHQVVAVLLSLEEPYRSTVALRFFEGLPPRKVAARMGVPVNTIRSRLRRALASMRLELDREFSDRRTWALPLLARYGTMSAVSSALLLGIIMKAKTLVVAACLLIALATTWLLLSHEALPLDSQVPQVAGSGGSTLRADLGATDQDLASAVERSEIDVPQMDTGDLEVQVRWRDDRSPVANFALKLGKTMTDPFSRSTIALTTDADGIAQRQTGQPCHGRPGSGQLCYAAPVPDADRRRFRIRILNPGHIFLRAGHPHHGEARVELEVLAGETRSWEPRLESGGVISGQVVDEGGEPLGGLLVLPFSPGQGITMFERVPTSNDGAFLILGCDQAFYRLSVLESGSLNAQVLVVLEGVQPDGEPLRIVVRDAERPSAYLRGKLVRPAGFESFLVRLQVSSETPGWGVMHGVEPDGEFRIGPLTTGTYKMGPLTYRTPLGGFSFPDVELGPGEEVDLGVIHIPPPTWLVVSIRYQDGSQVEESTVSLFDLADSRRRPGVGRWVRGSMRPNHYSPGRYRLELLAEQHVPWSREIELVEGQTTAVDATVERARASRISLVLPAGIEAPEILRVTLRREGVTDDRTIDLLRGERHVPLGLGAYVAEIRDAESSLTGTIRFVVHELAGPELKIQLPAR